MASGKREKKGETRVGAETGALAAAARCEERRRKEGMRRSLFFSEDSRTRIGSGSYIFLGLASEEKLHNIEKTYGNPVGEMVERQKLLSLKSASIDLERSLNDPTASSFLDDVAPASGPGSWRLI